MKIYSRANATNFFSLLDKFPVIATMLVHFAVNAYFFHVTNTQALQQKIGKQSFVGLTIFTFIKRNLDILNQLVSDIGLILV